MVDFNKLLFYSHLCRCSTPRHRRARETRWWHRRHTFDDIDKQTSHSADDNVDGTDQSPPSEMLKLQRKNDFVVYTYLSST
jgi:hypothetical protein